MFELCFFGAFQMGGCAAQLFAGLVLLHSHHPRKHPHCKWLKVLWLCVLMDWWIGAFIQSCFEGTWGFLNSWFINTPTAYMFKKKNLELNDSLLHLLICFVLLFSLCCPSHFLSLLCSLGLGSFQRYKLAWWLQIYPRFHVADLVGRSGVSQTYCILCLDSCQM